MNRRWTIADLKNAPAARRNAHLLDNATQVSDTKKKNKYGNVKVQDEFGNSYDSKKEYNRYKALRIKLLAGEIVTLARQVEYRLAANGVGVGSYIADFVYTDSNGAVVTEDVKSAATRRLVVYRLKRRLMWAVHKIKIQEV